MGKFQALRPCRGERNNETFRFGGRPAKPVSGRNFMSLARAPGYGAVAKILHWLIFALLAVQYTIGSIMPHIGRRTQDQGWVAWHFSVGAAILFFIVLRLIWRLFHPV